MSSDPRQRLADWAKRTLGLDYPGPRQSVIDEALARIREALGLSDEQIAEQAEHGDAAVTSRLIPALTVGETYFFRDPQHFELVRQVLRAARTDETVAMWSAGCASGCEAYTMAILAIEQFGDRAIDRVNIVATDLDASALTAARRGVYRPWMMRGMDTAVRDRWFRPHGREWRLIDEVRQLVAFRHHNLVALPPPVTEAQIAFCRNVLVYFDGHGIERAALVLRTSLAKGGYLVTGPSDPLLTQHGFSLTADLGFFAHRIADPERASEPSEPSEPVSEPPATDVLPQRNTPTMDPDFEVELFAPPETEASSTEASTNSSAEASLDAARVLADAGDSALAMEILDQLVASGDDGAEVYLLRAILLQASGELHEAWREVRSALLLDRQLAHAHLVQASCALALGDITSARRALRNARALAAEHEPDHVIDKLSGLTAGEIHSACNDLERVLRKR